MNTYEILPVVFDISGVCGPDIHRFLDKVGHIGADRRHNLRERRWPM